MIFVFYACIAVGMVLLYLDARGLLTASPERARAWRVIGIAAAAGPGLAPVLAWLLGRLDVAWPFPVIAIGDLATFLVFAVGVLRLAGPAMSTALRRLGYLGLLVIGALPSFALLFLSPLVALAGLGLVRPAGARSPRPDQPS